MQVAEIQLYPWDNKLYTFNTGNHGVKPGDRVVVKTDLGLEIGRVRIVRDIDGVLAGQEEIKTILRLANKDDLKKIEERAEKKIEAKKYCRKVAVKFTLPMKIIDVHISLDGSHMVFVFIADGRVDFRELVKELTRHFQKSIRMQQIGIRDEAKMVGEIGACGRGLCCKGILKALVNIRSDLIKLQQLENKASDRLSGVCGRLMCCLAYERDVYRECCNGIPGIGQKIRYDGKEWVVIARHILKRTVNLKGTDGAVIEIEVDKIKK